MREFMDSIQASADDQYPAEYLALTAEHKTWARDNKRWVIIDALAKRCFLMGVNQVDAKATSNAHWGHPGGHCFIPLRAKQVTCVASKEV